MAGCQGNQVLDRGLAGNVEDGVDPAAGSSLHSGDHALAVEHRGCPDLAQVVRSSEAEVTVPSPRPTGTPSIQR